MVEFCVAGEERGTEDEFAHDAAGGPDVDGGSVAGGGEEELGRAVPHRDDAGCEWAGSVFPGEPEVR